MSKQTRVSEALDNWPPPEVEGFDSLTGPPQRSNAQDWLPAELESERSAFE